MAPARSPLSVILAACFALIGATAVARADALPPEVGACQGKAEGATCQVDSKSPIGACRKSTCTKLDYANWNRDMMASPPTVEYECLKCLGTDGGVPPAADLTMSGSTADGGGKVGGGGGCSLTRTGAGRLLVVPWGLAVVLVVVAMRRRRG